MKILINGCGGQMGKEVAKLCHEGAFGVSAYYGVDKSGEKWARTLDETVGKYDCLIDFSSHLATSDVLSYAKSHDTPLVIGTTGQTEEELKKIENAASEVPVFLSSNLSVGVAVLRKMVVYLSRKMNDAEIEILETHGRGKCDAPSGTAKSIVNDLIKEMPERYSICGRMGERVCVFPEIGVHSIRIGNSPGRHEVLFSNGKEEISIKHEATGREVYAEGALRAAQFLCGKRPGLYSMDDLLEEKDEIL